jgi:hypothetical protein
MKKNILFPSLVMASFLLACKETPKTEAAPEAKIPLVEEVAAPRPLMECYRYTANNDTISIRLIKENELITGSLAYSFYEKDKSKGILEGHISGDTLFAVYEYTSEGMLSKREVAFLKRGNTLVEGYGEVEQVDNMFRFKEGAVLNFGNSIVLSATDCKQ